MFARTAIYRGMLVALKPIEKSRVELTRSLLIELKNVSHFMFVISLYFSFSFQLKPLIVSR